MKSLNIKHERQTYTNILQDINYIEAVSEWSISICKTDPYRISEPIVEVIPLPDKTAQIKVSYDALKPTRLQKLYYKYYVGVPVESFAKTMRGN